MPGALEWAHNRRVVLLLLLFGAPFAALVGGCVAMHLVAAFSGVPLTASDAFGTAINGAGGGVILALLLFGAVGRHAKSDRSLLARIELGLGVAAMAAGLALGGRFAFVHEWALSAGVHAEAMRRCGEPARPLEPLSRPSSCVRAARIRLRSGPVSAPRSPSRSAGAR